MEDNISATTTLRMNVETKPSMDLPKDWSRPQPDHLPRPTAWPAALSLGATLLVWGIVTLWLVALMGALIFVVSLAGWIHDIRKERHELEHAERPTS